MRHRYLRPLYTLRIQWAPSLSGVQGYPSALGVPRMSKKKALGHVVTLALAREQRVEKAWLVIYRRKNITWREADWMIEQYLTGAVPNAGVVSALLTAQDDIESKLVPLIGDRP